MEHPENRYDPDEKFSLDEDPEDVLRTILGADDDEGEEPVDSEEAEP